VPRTDAIMRDVGLTKRSLWNWALKHHPCLFQRIEYSSLKEWDGERLDHADISCCVDLRTALILSLHDHGFKVTWAWLCSPKRSRNDEASSEMHS